MYGPLNRSKSEKPSRHDRQSWDSPLAFQISPAFVFFFVFFALFVSIASNPSLIPQATSLKLTDNFGSNIISPRSARPTTGTFNSTAENRTEYDRENMNCVAKRLIHKSTGLCHEHPHTDEEFFAFWRQTARKLGRGQMPYLNFRAPKMQNSCYAG